MPNESPLYSFHLPAQMLEDLKAMAERHAIPGEAPNVSRLIRAAISDYLKKEAGK